MLNVIRNKKMSVKLKARCIACVAVALSVSTPVSAAANATRADWMRDADYGVFVHYLADAEVSVVRADDVVVCDFIKAEIRFLKSGERIDLAEARNEYCLREIAYFFDFALDGAANINSIPYANSIIEYIQGRC